MVQSSKLSRFLHGLGYARRSQADRDVSGELSIVEDDIPSPPDLPNLPPPLPQELVDRIIDNLQGDQMALTTCTLVSHTWSYRSSGHILRNLHISSLRLDTFVADLNSPRSRLPLHIQRLRLQYQQPLIERDETAVHTLPEAYTIDVSNLLLAIRDLGLQLERFSISDSSRNTRCLRVREDGSRLISPYTLTFHGDVHFKGISAESIIAFLLECSYVRALSIESTCVPPYLVVPALMGSRYLQVGTLKISGDMEILRHMAPLLAPPSHLTEIEATFDTLQGCTANLSRLNAFVATTGHKLQTIRLRWTKVNPPRMREMSKDILKAFKGAEMLQCIEIPITRHEDWKFLVVYVLPNAPLSLRRVRVNIHWQFHFSFQSMITRNSWKSVFDVVSALSNFECFECRAAWALLPAETKTAAMSTVPTQYRSMVAFPRCSIEELS